MTHLLDPVKGRANVRRFWTACGEARSTRIVIRDLKQVSCGRCLAIAEDWRRLLTTPANRRAFYEMFLKKRGS